jgi:hypothetical protein
VHLGVLHVAACGRANSGQNRELLSASQIWFTVPFNCLRELATTDSWGAISRAAPAGECFISRISRPVSAIWYQLGPAPREDLS